MNKSECESVGGGIRYASVISEKLSPLANQKYETELL